MPMRKSHNGKDMSLKTVLIRAHRFVFFTMVIAYIALAGLAVYAVSVLDRNDVVRSIDTNVNAITAYLEQISETGERVISEFTDEYRNKTRVVSVMITDAESLEEDESVLEEIRVAVDAEEVSVFTYDGNIAATTASYGKSASIDPEFRAHLNERNYSGAVVHEDEESPCIVAASQLKDDGYMLQITFDAKPLIELSENNSLASAARNFPLYTEGDTVIIDEETFTYVSHTSKNKIGTKCSLAKEQFKRNKSKFDDVLSDESVMVRYHKYDGYIIAAFVPYDDIFKASYAVLGWMIGGGVAILTTAALGMRMSVIKALRTANDK